MFLLDPSTVDLYGRIAPSRTHFSMDRFVQTPGFPISLFLVFWGSHSFYLWSQTSLAVPFTLTSRHSTRLPGITVIMDETALASVWQGKLSGSKLPAALPTSFAHAKMHKQRLGKSGTSTTRRLRDVCIPTSRGIHVQPAIKDSSLTIIISTRKTHSSAFRTAKNVVPKTMQRDNLGNRIPI